MGAAARARSPGRAKASHRTNKTASSGRKQQHPVVVGVDGPKMKQQQNKGDGSCTSPRPRPLTQNVRLRAFLPGLRNRLTLHAIGLLPCFVMLHYCIFSKAAIRAVFTFHALIAVVPLVYLTLKQM